MRPALFRHLSLAFFLLLTACSALQPKPPQVPQSEAAYRQHLASLQDVTQFNIRGRIGVQTNPKGFSGSLQWQHDTARDQILLFSPLGGQVAQINTIDDGVELLTSDGKRYQAADAATLTQQTLGWSLPMHGLPDWVIGRPSTGSIKNATWDAMGRLTTLQQDGWDIEYADYLVTDGHQLPTRISLRSPKLNLKLIIERWQLMPDAKDAQADTGNDP